MTPQVTARFIRGVGAASLFSLSAVPPAEAWEGYSVASRASWSWGTTRSAQVRLVAAEDHPADVIFANALTQGNPLEMAFTLEIEGLSVEVEVVNGQGVAPDVITVTPPRGLVAVPPTVAVQEGETIRIEIREALLS